MNKKTVIGAMAILVLVLGGYLVFSQNKSAKLSAPIAEKNTETSQAEPVVKPAMTVNWETPKPISAPDVFSHEYVNDSMKQFLQSTEHGSHFFELGVFNTGKYQGGTLLLAQIPCEAFCEYWYTKIVLYQNGYFVLTNDNSGEITIFDAKKVIQDPSYVIPELVLPEEIVDTKNNVTLLNYSGNNRNVVSFDSTGLPLAFTDPVFGNIYTTPENPSDIADEYLKNGFYVPLPDGNMGIYQETFDFIEPDSVDARINGDGVPKIIWNNGSINTIPYAYQQEGGCGAVNLADVVSNLVRKDTDLVKAGVTNTGKPIYELKDSNTQLLKDFYKEVVGGGMNLYKFNQQDEMSYDTYLKAHPLFFFIDPYNRIIRFHNQHLFSPAGGCGKPVIYLYPTQDMNVSVKLSPVGGFTKTEPSYGNGWNVFAKTTGELKDIATGILYPYLFWEGNGGLYEMPNKGWVIKQNEVHVFLNEKLAVLGLNKKEITDFEEFWEPRMTGSPYYFVTFMGNQTMNQIAPLTVIPKPDTVIRILMDFKPLDKPALVEPVKIKTPERKGFTVVEWGGVLR